ncbi:MAG: SMP-30/gluconolactonase/LRE family protein [Saprospiraceae bacterium]|nr:SMP-30/gluconolactonase/LRE family protein [Saprospiraceae bacterium]
MTKRVFRRQFLKNTTRVVAGISLSSWMIAGEQNADPYAELKSRKYLGKVKIETRIPDDSTFSEGPAVDRSGNVYFTNIPANKIYKWDPSKKDLSVFRENTHSANGLRFNPQGDLLVCESGTGSVIKIDMKNGARKVLADSFQGKGIQSPNDLDFDNRGNIYFSSRTNEPDAERENKRGLYLIDSSGYIRLLIYEPDVQMPNGVVVSPNDATLYLIEAHPGADYNRKILAFDLNERGDLSNQRVLYDFYPGRSGDGMCIDAKGNLYVAAGLHKTRNTSETLDTKPGIHVISPKGELLAFRETPEDTITNCTFGGKDLKTLYITCGSLLLSIRTRIPGKASYLPNG